jgi:hypothetical protein
MDYISNIFSSKSPVTSVNTCNIVECNNNCIKQNFSSGYCSTTPQNDNSVLNVCSCIK